MRRSVEIPKAIFAAVNTTGVATSRRGVFYFCTGYLRKLIHPKITFAEINDYIQELHEDGLIFFEDGFIQETYTGPR